MANETRKEVQELLEDEKNFSTRAGLRLVQLGPAGTRLLHGVEHYPTNTFREACAALARSRAAVLHEGGLHHAAAAVVKEGE